MISVHTPTRRSGEGGLRRTRNRFLNDGKQLFLKLSYLFRF
jgi:hypothetical protein